MSPIGWELYRTYLSVLTEGSLSGAARRLGLTQPTVGRHIDALEQALGVALFTRSQQGLAPTDAARELRPFADTMASNAAALERAASAQGQDVQGVVRISASEVMGVEVLPPIIAAIRRRYPALTFELVLSNQIQDLLRREVDIAVRMTRPQQGQLIARRVGEIDVGLHAHRDYLDQNGTPRAVADLQNHALVGYDTVTPFIRAASASFQGMRRETFAIASDSDIAQLALIRHGAGIGGCQVLLAKRDPALVRVLADAVSLRLETWVTMHEDLRASPRCRVTFDALVEALQRYIGN